MMEKLNLAKARISLVIHGDSAKEILVNTNGALTFFVDIPIENVTIPEEIQGGKFLWQYGDGRGTWHDMEETENKVHYYRERKLSVVLGKGSERNKIKFCYESPGGNHADDRGFFDRWELSHLDFIESAIALEPYTSEILNACLEELRQEKGMDSENKVIRQYVIEGLVPAVSDDPDGAPLIKMKDVSQYEIKGTDLQAVPRN